MDLKSLQDPAQEEADQAEFAAAMRDAPPVDVRLSAESALALISVVQLALRHPSLQTNATAQHVKRIVQQLAAALPMELLPLIAAGFDPRFDRPV